MSKVSVELALEQANSLEQFPNTRFPGIPGRKGLPLVGDAIPFFKDTLAHQRTCYEKYGPVYYTRMGPEFQVNIVDPDAAQLLALDPDRNFSARMGYENNLAQFFPNGLLLKDFSDHKMHRRIMQSAFKNERLESYMPAIHEIVRRHVAGWQQQDELLFVNAVKD